MRVCSQGCVDAAGRCSNIHTTCSNHLLSAMSSSCHSGLLPAPTAQYHHQTTHTACSSTSGGPSWHPQGLQLQHGSDVASTDELGNNALPCGTVALAQVCHYLCF